MVSYNYEYFDRRLWEERLLSLCHTPCLTYGLMTMQVFTVTVEFPSTEWRNVKSQ